MRLTKIMAITALAAIATIVTVPTSAQASTEHNGVVELDEFGLYYAPGSSGLVFDMYGGDSNLSGNVFPGTSTRVDNNTAAYRNRSPFSFHVYTGANYTGVQGCLPYNYVGNASTTFRNTISSAFWSGGGSC